MADVFDVDAWLDDYTARQAEARLWPQALVEEHAQLEQVLADPTLGPADKVPVAQRQAQVEAEGEAQARVFRFKAVSTKAWADLVAKHPPTKEQSKADPQLDFNPVTFPAVAVAASSLEPKLTAEQVERIRGTVQFAEWQQLWSATLDANLGALTAFPKSPLGAAMRHLSNGASGRTAAPAASAGRTSSAGRRPTSGQRSNGKPSKTRSARAAASPATSPSPPTT